MSTLDIAVEMKLDGSNWTDVSADVVAPISVKYGIMGNGVLDRVAGTGIMTFALDNSIANSAHVAGYYSPSCIGCVSGFEVGCMVRLKVTYNTWVFYKFLGRIPAKGIEPVPGIRGRRITHVTVNDWMDQAAIHELDKPAYTTSKKMDEIMALIVANMPIAPTNTEYHVGDQTYNHVFDTVRSKTRALQEFQKLALSEGGYIYIKRDRTAGETLVCDGRYERSEISSIAVTGPVEDAGFLLLENGGKLLQENGDSILLDDLDSVDVEIDDSHILDMKVSNGSDVYSIVKMISYPRNQDASAVVLFELQRRVLVEAGKTVNITGNYRDPTGGTNNVSGIDMVTPVASTDYSMTAAEDGTGTDLTADLTVTATYGTNTVDYALQNTGATNGYVWVRARGKGVYIYDPVELTESDAAGLLAFGTLILSIDAKYQDDPMFAAEIVPILLESHKNPQPSVDWVEISPNRSHSDMLFFLQLEPGNKIRLQETQSIPVADYFVQGVDFSINTGKEDPIIRCKYFLKNAAWDTYDFAVWDTDKWDDGSSWGF
jgi:hypothetical protein